MTESDTKAKATKRSRSTRFLINAALTMASVLVLVIVLEIAVRVFLPQRHGLAYTHFDPELGWMQKPNSEYYYQRENKQPSHVSTNAHGLRTPDIPLQKEDSVFRVLFIGDSFVQALAVDDDSTFCRRLELALNEQTDDHEFQIVNGGVDGFSPVQEMLLLERFISVYNPDLVVQLFFAGNDFVDNADRAGRRRPMGRIDDTGELIVIPPTPQDGFLSRNRDRLLEKSQLAFLLRVKIIPRTEILATVAQRLGLARYSGLRSRNFDIEKEWDVLCESIKKSQAKSREYGADYALVVLSRPSDAEGGMLERPKAPFDEAAQLQRLTAFFEDESIPYFDLTSALAEVPSEQKIYFKGVGHFTEFGHRRAAEVLKPFVEDLAAAHTKR